RVEEEDNNIHFAVWFVGFCSSKNGYEPNCITAVILKFPPWRDSSAFGNSTEHYGSSNKGMK
ncbi:MAG TPA: hypothetical protein VKC90_15945, partial [Chitinophagaceae bacterium]|nr:hypothetical protein [Chitinophagaceae bacterium]